MCIGGRPAYGSVQRDPAAYEDAPPIVTGMQTGVSNPKDTKKVTEDLKIKRQKEEGTYVDPNLSRTEELLTGSGGSRMSLAQRQRRSDNQQRAKSMARARLSRNSRMSGSRSSKRR